MLEKRKQQFIMLGVFVFALLFSGKVVSAQEVFTQNNICYEVTGSNTVEVDDLTKEYNQKRLEIPETVTYNNQTYMVTAVNMDHLGPIYHSVEEMLIPASVTEQVVVARQDYDRYIQYMLEHGNDDYEDLNLRKDFFGLVDDEGEWTVSYDNGQNFQAFPNLKQISFLGKTPPKNIQIERYVFEYDLCYIVPEGTENAYKTVAKDINVFFFAGYNGVKECSSYKVRKISPLIMQENHNNIEKNIFSTKKGLYLVKEKAETGTGKVILLHAYPQVDLVGQIQTLEYVMESTVKNGKYTYAVDEVESAAFTEINTYVLTIPDTVTTLNEASLPSEAWYVFLSKNVKKLPVGVMQYEIAQPSCRLLYATGLKEYKYNSIGADILIVNKETKIKNENQIGSEVKRVTPVSSGEAIKVSDKLKVTVSESKRLKASFKKKTKEHLMYMLLCTSHRSSDDDENSYVRMSDTNQITAKKAGVSYVLVYSLESGKHKIVEIESKDRTFKKGIYTYAINNTGAKNTVTIKKCEPGKNIKTLVLPSSVTYKGITYTVTGAYGQPSFDLEDYDYDVHFKEGMNEKFYKTGQPIVSHKTAKKSKIKKIVVPATMTEEVILTSKLSKLNTIECKGKKPPKVLCYWGADETQVTVRVPKNKVGKYKSRVYGQGKDWNRNSVKKYVKKYIKESK